uniref:Leucine rich repeat protein 1 n=1 Tax=Cyanoderma ruficeps TaxID=181631 RepID=A0A8C3RCZ0_9PASS
MRLQCEVEVLSRLLPTCGLRGRGRAARALVSLGRPPGAAGAGIYLMVCTARDRGGARYKVQQNVERLFTRFVEDGKATVRLREPAVDLCLSKKSFLTLKDEEKRGKEISKRWKWEYWLPEVPLLVLCRDLLHSAGSGLELGNVSAEHSPLEQELSILGLCWGLFPFSRSGPASPDPPQLRFPGQHSEL